MTNPKTITLSPAQMKFLYALHGERGFIQIHRFDLHGLSRTTMYALAARGLVRVISTEAYSGGLIAEETGVRLTPAGREIARQLIP